MLHFGEHRYLNKQIVPNQEYRAYGNFIKLYHSRGKRLAMGQNRRFIIVPSRARRGDFIVGLPSLSERRLIIRPYEGKPPAELETAIPKAFQASQIMDGTPEDLRNSLLVPRQGYPGLGEVGQAHYDWRWDGVTDYQSEIQRDFGGHGILIGEAF